MTITMASAAISSAGPEMTSLDTMPVTRMATRLAWKAGWAPSVTKVCGRVNKLRVSVTSRVKFSPHMLSGGSVRSGETWAYSVPDAHRC